MAQAVEYGVTDKRCVCNGLTSVLKMVEFYRDYAVDVKRIPATRENKETALKITKDLLGRVKPKDASAPLASHFVEKAKTELVACESELDGCMMALEWIRSAIHDDWGLRAKLTCQKWKPGLGTEFVREQPYAAIGEAMYNLAGWGTLEDGVKRIKKELEKQTCI